MESPVFLIIILSCSCARIQVYPNVDSPKFIDNTIAAGEIWEKHISVVSFNIEKSLKVDLTISELLTDSSFAQMDILLLQEVNAKSVIKIANRFGLNYLYYPILAKISNNSEFGNAILSKNKITKENKLILPHKKQNGRIRNATYHLRSKHSWNF